MGLAFSATLGLCLWIVVWATGAKPFDAFLLAIAVVVLASTARLVAPYLPGNRD